MKKIKIIAVVLFLNNLSSVLSSDKNPQQSQTKKRAENFSEDFSSTHKEGKKTIFKYAGGDSFSLDESGKVTYQKAEKPKSK